MCTYEKVEYIIYIDDFFWDAVDFYYNCYDSHQPVNREWNFFLRIQHVTSIVLAVLSRHPINDDQSIFQSAMRCLKNHNSTIRWRGMEHIIRAGCICDSIQLRTIFIDFAWYNYLYTFRFRNYAHIYYIYERCMYRTIMTFVFVIIIIICPWIYHVNFVGI